MDREDEMNLRSACIRYAIDINNEAEVKPIPVKRLIEDATCIYRFIKGESHDA